MEEHDRPRRSHPRGRSSLVSPSPLTGRAFFAWYAVSPRLLLRRSTTWLTLAMARSATRRRDCPVSPSSASTSVYLLLIHPVGRTLPERKEAICSTPGPDDVGSPWAIGNEHGGHTAIEPALGTLDHFDHFVGTARELGMEVALDYALQCSPDHPWVPRTSRVVPSFGPDGSIKYAENPPKKYQDIYPLDFWCDDRIGLCGTRVATPALFGLGTA